MNLLSYWPIAVAVLLAYVTGRFWAKNEHLEKQQSIWHSIFAMLYGHWSLCAGCIFVCWADPGLANTVDSNILLLYPYLFFPLVGALFLGTLHKDMQRWYRQRRTPKALAASS